MKYESSVSELTPPPNFSLIPLKIGKLDFDPKTKNDINYTEPVMKSSILLQFWIGEGGGGGGIHPHTSWMFPR